VKFIITHFDDAAQRSLMLLDGHFYQMHDEWYWMRLLNGFEVPGSDARPISGLDLRDVKAAYTWAKQHDKLPLDLAWTEDGRLFSGDFYLSCLGRGRRFGIGSLLRVANKRDGGAPGWVFQLEYIDNPSRVELQTFFDALAQALPADVAKGLRWLTRSAEQEAFARELQAAKDPIAASVLHLRDIVGADRIEVYSEGITAGQVRLFKTALPTPGATNADDIVVVAAAPDELPAGAGLITATPQTPLAHVTLLAKNRGIPNVFVADAFSDPAIMTAVKDGGKAVLRAEAPNRLALIPITDEQFAAWEELRRPAPLVVAPVDTSGAPYALALEQLSYESLARYRPMVGGKAAGYVLLASQSRLAIPTPALAITTRAYDEHLRSLYPRIDNVLRDHSFSTDPKLRFLLLEGIERFQATHPGDKKTVARFVAEHGKSSELVTLALAGGVRGLIRQKPVEPSTLQALREHLERQFGKTPSALRFRSSSTVEDIDGFNAAGLYESATGYLDATPPQPVGPAPTQPKLRRSKQKTIEAAIKRVWASYWGFVAFEERRRERVDHASGKMAILVHPRFDDAREQANGVLTLTHLPTGDDEMRMSVQLGAESVTNPTGNSLPEVIRVERHAADKPVIARVQASSLSAKPILDGAQLLELFETSAALTGTALADANHELSAAQRRSTYTLDIEFRLMAERVTSGARLVLKQARSLEPEPRGMLRSLLAEPVARDLLTRARRVERFTCQSPEINVSQLSLFTDLKSTPDMGYREQPFTAWVRLERRGEAPVQWLHGDFSRLVRAVPRGPQAYALDADLQAVAAQQTGWRSVQLENGRVRLTKRDGRVLEHSVNCTKDVLFTAAEDYLLDLIRR
jgi:hypothetical protein